MGKKRTEPYDITVVVCQGSDCRKRHSKALRKAAKQALRDAGLRKRSIVIKSECTGNCKCAPVAAVQPGNQWLYEATEKQLLAAIARAAETIQSVD